MDKLVKLAEHTYGLHIYMRMAINDEKYEISVCFTDNGEIIKTTADGTRMREKVIEAFNKLY